MAASAPVYCWDPDLAIEYEMVPGKNCGDDHRITEEQFNIQRARREEAERAKTEPEQQAQAQQPKIKPAEPPSPSVPPSVNQNPAAPTKPQPVASQPVQPALVSPPQINLDDYHVAGFGSAFFVSSAGHLLSNHHVISDCDVMAIVAAGGLYEASVRDSNERFDLALLQTPFGVEHFAKFAAVMPEQGDEVFAIGYPLVDSFWEIKITDGIVSGLSGLNRDRSRIQMTAAIQPGNSGGPLVNVSGQVVGVVVSKISGKVAGDVYAEGINFAIIHEAAATFLGLNGVTVKRSTATKELKGRDVMRQASSWTVPLFCLAKKSSG